MARCIASLLVLLWATQPTAASSPNCTWWYETTSHGPAYRNVLDFGAIGDGIHDDTAAIQAAIDYNQTGYSGSNVSKSAAVVYLPYGTYLVSDTLTLWFYTHLVGSAACTPTILLKQSSAGFGGGFKPIIAVNGGFNSSASEHSWWLQYHQIGGHANDLFYTNARNLKIVTQGNNSGAVGIYWGVAQQTSLRNISIDLSAGGAIGIDEGGRLYRRVPTWTDAGWRGEYGGCGHHRGQHRAARVLVAVDVPQHGHHERIHSVCLSHADDVDAGVRGVERS